MKTNFENMKTELLSVINSQYFSSTTFDKFINRIEQIMHKYGFREEKSEVESIYIGNVNGIGDAILISGFLRELKRGYPQAAITLTCYPHIKEMMEFCPYVDEFVTIDKTFYDNLLSEMTSCVSYIVDNHIWDRHVDLGISTHCTETMEGSILQAWLSGARKRIGFSNKYNNNYFGDDEQYKSVSILDNLLTDTVNYPLEVINDVDRRYCMLRQLGINVEKKDLEMWTSEKDKEKAKKIFAPYPGRKIVLGLGGSSDNKRYPQNLYQKAIEEIKKIDKVTFFAVGGDDILIYPEPDAVNLCGKLSIRETEALIEQADMYIGNDTCTVHMAAAAKKPIILLCREGKDKTEKYMGLMSAYKRFYPYMGGKTIVIQPDKSIDECTDAVIHGGCCHYEAHCIATIPYEKIVKAYKEIIKKAY